MHMRKRNRLRGLLGLLVVTALVLSVSVYAPADTVQDKKQQVEQIKNEVQAIDSRLDIVVEQYNTAVLRAEQNRAAIQHNEANIATMQEQIKERQAILGARLREMYMIGNTDFSRCSPTARAWTISSPTSHWRGASATTTSASSSR